MKMREITWFPMRHPLMSLTYQAIGVIVIPLGHHLGMRQEPPVLITHLLELLDLLHHDHTKPRWLPLLIEPVRLTVRVYHHLIICLPHPNLPNIGRNPTHPDYRNTSSYIGYTYTRPRTSPFSRLSLVRIIDWSSSRTLNSYNHQHPEKLWII